MAAIDRVVHHSVILDMMSVESYRAEVANQQHLRLHHAAETPLIVASSEDPSAKVIATISTK